MSRALLKWEKEGPFSCQRKGWLANQKLIKTKKEERKIRKNKKMTLKQRKKMRKDNKIGILSKESSTILKLNLVVMI